MALATSVQFTHVARAHPLGVGSGRSGPLNIFIDLPLNVDTIFNFLLTPNSEQSSHMLVWNVFLCFQWKFDYFKISISTILHQIKRFKFEIPKKILGRGSPSPSPVPFPRSFSGFALDSGFARFRPPTFDAWWRPCHGDAICICLCPTSAEWKRKKYVSKKMLQKITYDNNKIPIFKTFPGATVDTTTPHTSMHNNITGDGTHGRGLA